VTLMGEKGLGCRNGGGCNAVFMPCEDSEAMAALLRARRRERQDWVLPEKKDPGE